METKEIMRKDIFAGSGGPSNSSTTDEPPEEISDVGNQQGGGASQQNFFGAVDGHSEARFAPAAEDGGSHENGDGDRSNAPASRHADEMGAEDHRDDNAEENGPVRRAKQIKKGKTDGAADQSIHEAGVEGQKRGAEFRLGDGDDGDERPQRVGVMDALENKPHDDATDQNTHRVLPTGRLDRRCGKALGFRSHSSPAPHARIQ